MPKLQYRQPTLRVHSKPETQRRQDRVIRRCVDEDGTLNYVASNSKFVCLLPERDIAKPEENLFIVYHLAHTLPDLAIRDSCDYGRLGRGKSCVGDPAGPSQDEGLVSIIRLGIGMSL